MNSGYKQGPLPTGNPLANALVVVVGALAIGVSLVLGMVAFVVLGSVVLVLAAIVAIRLWWFQRGMKKQGRNRSSARSDRQEDGVIEGEFRIVSADKDSSESR